LRFALIALDRANIVPGTKLVTTRGMDAVRLLGRAAKVEQSAAEIYEKLASHFTSDRLLHQFWSNMAAQERRHAKKLGTWQELLEQWPATEWPDIGDFEMAIGELEKIAGGLRARAENAKSPDDAFAIALELETSELDVIYTTLLQASPIARFPDLAETQRVEIGPHHRALVDLVHARSCDEHNRMLAALLAVEES
jgi:rubrerythrin